MIKMKPLKISAVNLYIKNIISKDPILANIIVEGEVSNLKIHSSGHVYLTLKDEQSKLNAVIFNGNKKILSQNIIDGAQVSATGYISVYEKDGSYQLYIKEIEEVGQGNLFKKFEDLKNNLENKGYFDQKSKKKLPKYPKKIGIVTSPTGAAVRDMITVIKRRMPLTEILIYPVLVQGTEAPFDISKGLIFMDDREDVDVVIVGRGGGSIEELWAFNEELVAKTLHNMRKPVISAVGHETDFTIADFVADLRAPTPSVAGELAVMDIRAVKNELAEQKKLLANIIQKQLMFRERKLEDYNIKGIGNSLQKSLAYRQKEINTEFNLLELKVKQNLEIKSTQLIHNGKLLNINNPLNMLDKGYVIVTKDKARIKSVEEVSELDDLLIQFKDGNVKVKVTSKQ